jgi:hypothetical protein
MGFKLLSYNDIEYIRFNDIDIELQDKTIIKIHPLDVFLEVKLLQLSQAVNIENLEKDLYNTNPANALKIHEIIQIATGEKLNNINDIATVYISIFSNIILPIINFIMDKNFTEYLRIDKNKNDIDIDNDDENKIIQKNILEHYPFFSLISNVLSHIHIPEYCMKFLGLRYFLWANRYIQIMKNYDTLYNISLLHETANFTGLRANTNVDWREFDYKPYDNIIKNVYEDLNIKRDEIKNGSGSILSIVNDIEKSGKSLTNREYYDKYIAKKNNN